MRVENKEFPKEVAMLIMTAGYALDFEYMIELSKKNRKPGVEADKSFDIMSGIIMLISADMKKTIFHTFDKTLLIKKLASYFFFEFYNAFSDILFGVYLDIDQRQLVFKYDDCENMVAVDTMRIAKNIVNNALIVTNAGNGEVLVDGEAIHNAIDFEFERKRPVNPNSYIFED
jgi:hypothetical protein